MQNIWTNWVLNVFSLDIIFIMYYITYIKIFKVSLGKKKTLNIQSGDLIFDRDPLLNYENIR